MKLLINRLKYYPTTTIGELLVDGKRLCYILEDTLRPHSIKVKHSTAIPEGNYKVKITMSSRFKRKMPMIYTEANEYQIKKGGIEFSGVRIHSGNSDEDTSGCPIVGLENTGDKVYQSKAAEAAMMSLLEAATDEITLIVINNPQKS